MKNVKFAFVSFFEVFPVNFGSSIVCSSLFNKWPFKKKYFQLSNKKGSKKIKNIFYFKNSFGKLIAIPLMFISLKNYLNAKNNIVIIEGVSWIGFSYFLLLLTKLFIKNVKIVYKSHSIEYEIRKRNNNFLIWSLTKYFEKKVFEKSDLSTAVSINEQKKIYKYYKVKTFLFFNTINYLKKYKKKKNNKNYIFFAGSYLYKPNAYSIDQLINFIMPELIKKDPTIKLLILGNKSLVYKRNWLHTKITTKINYLNYLNNSLALIVPSNESYGSKVKIIEALCYGVPVVSTNTGIRGINIISKYQPSVQKNNKSIVKKILDIKKSQKRYLYHSNKVRQKYIKMHDINENIDRLIKELKFHVK